MDLAPFVDHSIPKDQLALKPCRANTSSTAILMAAPTSCAAVSGQVTNAATTAERQGCEPKTVISVPFW